MRIYSSDAKDATKSKAERDKILPKWTMLEGPEMPSSIKALEITDDGSILAMNESRVFRINQDSASVNPLDIEDLVLDQDEKLVGMQIRGGYLYLLTPQRVLSVVLGSGMVREKRLPRRIAYEGVPWDVIHTENAATFLFVDGGPKAKIERVEWSCQSE